MRVLHVVASLAAEWGGASSVAVSLTEGLAQRGIECYIFAPDFPRGRQHIHPRGVEVRLFPTGWLARRWKGYSPSLAKGLMKAAQNVDVVHIHELWHYPHFAAYRAAIRWEKPYVITIHGSLEPWALGYKATQKRVYMRMIQHRMLEKSAALHALTSEEKHQIRSLGVHAPVAIIPNGINALDFTNIPCRTEFEVRYPELKGKRVVLFLSRIHPKKGLDLLSKAFGRVIEQLGRDDVHLVIAGPDDAGYQGKVEAMLRAEGVLHRTTFAGMLQGRIKLAALARADVFVLPSYSEGFSVAILEGLACALPVVITNQCNFPEVAKLGAGEVIQPDVDALTAALNKLLRDSILREEMGRNGRKLVLERYTWDHISAQMADLHCAVSDGIPIHE